jgi:hypothetical protein
MIEKQEMHSDQLRKIKKLKKMAQNGIVKVEARLNRMIICDDYRFRDLQKKIWGLDKDTTFVRRRGMLPYRYRGFVGWNGLNIIVYYSRYSYHSKKARIEITGITVDSLLELCRLIPDASVHSLEFTIDIFCKNPKQVADLFRVFLSYLYVPHQRRKMEFFGDRFFGDSRDYERRLNAGIRVGKMRVYERGPDEKRVETIPNEYGRTRLFWWHWHVDRVRIKIVFDRSHPGRGGLDEFLDLVREVNFKDKMRNLIQFKFFKEKNFLKKEKKGKVRVFQEVFHRARKSGLSPRKYMKDAKGLKKLKSKIELAVDKYDERWAKKRKRFLRKNPDMLSNIVLKSPSAKTQKRMKREWEASDPVANEKLLHDKIFKWG